MNPGFLACHSGSHSAPGTTALISIHSWENMPSIALLNFGPHSPYTILCVPLTLKRLIKRESNNCPSGAPARIKDCRCHNPSVSKADLGLVSSCRLPPPMDRLGTGGTQFHQPPSEDAMLPMGWHTQAAERPPSRASFYRAHRDTRGHTQGARLGGLCLSPGQDGAGNLPAF